MVEPSVATRAGSEDGKFARVVTVRKTPAISFEPLPVMRRGSREVSNASSYIRKRKRKTYWESMTRSNNSHKIQTLDPHHPAHGDSSYTSGTNSVQSSSSTYVYPSSQHDVIRTEQSHQWITAVHSTLLFSISFTITRHQNLSDQCMRWPQSAFFYSWGQMHQWTCALRKPPCKVLRYCWAPCVMTYVGYMDTPFTAPWCKTLHMARWQTSSKNV